MSTVRSEAKDFSEVACLMQKLIGMYQKIDALSMEYVGLLCGKAIDFRYIDFTDECSSCCLMRRVLICMPTLASLVSKNLPAEQYGCEGNGGQKNGGPIGLAANLTGDRLDGC
jgi:hypothetical protein